MSSIKPLLLDSQLMMGFTSDGQLAPGMVAAGDQRFGLVSATKRKDRAGIEAPPIDPGADAWQQGKVVQIADSTCSQHGAEARPNKQQPLGSSCANRAQSTLRPWNLFA